MNKLLVVILFSTLLFAKSDYYIFYQGITLGKIENINTFKKGYLVAIPTNSWLKMLLNFDKYIIFENNKKPDIKGKTKYKKDRYFIISLINDLKVDRPEKKIFKQRDKTLTLECKDNNCTYTRVSTKNDDVYSGYINFTKDNKLDAICDNESSICIERK